MKLLYVVLLTFLVYENVEGKVYRQKRGPPRAGPPRTRASFPVLGSIEMPVDHYNPADNRTFEMGYYSNDQFFEKGSPIFIYLGGEGPIGSYDLMTGQVYELAETHKGYMFYPEHRYYGASLPTADWSTLNLKYLSADQALEDLAFFIKAKKAEIDGLKDSKVVVIGGSYAGTLTTWARLKYPHLIDVGYASSAPLRLKLDFFEYFEVVNKELKRASEKCVNTIQEAFTRIESLFNAENGTNFVSSLFNTVASTFAAPVQYSQVGTLEKVCDFIEEITGDSIDKLVAWNAEFYGGDCMGGYDDFIMETASEIPSESIDRLWFYQCCTEFGFFQTSNSVDQPFGNTFPVALNTQVCKDLFGEGFTGSEMNAAVDRTNLVYGSDEPAVTKLVSVHGSVDPWHTLGIKTSDSSADVVTIHVDGSSHCGDLDSVRENDLEQLKAAKLKVREIISEWISD